MAKRIINFQPDLFVKPHSVHQASCARHLIAQGYTIDHLVWPEVFIPSSVYNDSPSIEQFIDIVLANHEPSILAASQMHGLPGGLIIPTAKELKPIIDATTSLLGSRPYIGKKVFLNGLDMSEIPFFDLALTYKASKICITGNNIYSKAYDLLLFANVLVFYYGKHLFSKQVYSTVFYFNDYGPMTAMCLAARSSNVSSVTITAPAISGADFDKINLFNRPEILHRIKRNKIWHVVQGLGTPKAALLLMENELSNKIGSKVHTSYSPSSTDWEHEDLDGIRSDMSRIVLFPSSNDELYATTAHIKSVLRIELDDSLNLYSNQFEWIRDIADQCIEKKIQLIVRCHPRIDADHRGLPRSSEYDLWIQLGEQLENMGHVFIKPSSSISSYDLLVLANIVFVSWSSIAIEASLLGKRVYQFFCNISSVRHYPDDPCFLPHINEAVRLDRILSDASANNHLQSNFHLHASERIVQSAKFFTWYRYMTSFSYDDFDNMPNPKNQNKLFSNFLNRRGEPFVQSWPENEAYIHLINQLDAEQQYDKSTSDVSIEDQIVSLSKVFYESLSHSYPHCRSHLIVSWGF